MIRTQKWVLLAKQGLRKIYILKDQFGLKLGRGTKREREKSKEEEEEEEEDGGDQASQGMDAWILVWKLNLFMDSMRLCMNFHALLIILLPKSRVFVRVHLNPKFMSSKVGKTPHDTR